MPDPEFFHRLGLFVIRDFFDPGLCADLRRELSSAVKAKAEIYDKDKDLNKVDERERKSAIAKVSDPTFTVVTARLKGVKSKLEAHFSLQLNGYQAPQFLIYHPGNFFTQHRDNEPPESDGPEEFKDRRISAVIFLNGPSQQPGPESYEGGDFVFYQLIDEPQWERYGFHLRGEEGLLIAFPAALIHEVEPVTRGTRYSIVTWAV